MENLSIPVALAIVGKHGNAEQKSLVQRVKEFKTAGGGVAYSLAAVGVLMVAKEMLAKNGSEIIASAYGIN